MDSLTDFFSSAKYRPDLLRLYSVLQAALGMLRANFVLGLYRLCRIHNRTVTLIALQRELQSVKLLSMKENSAETKVGIGEKTKKRSLPPVL